jgi:hypothetical protein
MRIYPIFYILFLKLVLAGVLKAPYIEIDLINPSAIYDIEKILDYQLVKGILKYLIK